MILFVGQAVVLPHPQPVIVRSHTGHGLYFRACMHSCLSFAADQRNPAFLRMIGLASRLDLVVVSSCQCLQTSKTTSLKHATMKECHLKKQECGG